MNGRRKLRQWLKALFHKRQLDAEMEQEMQSHLELQTREHVVAGMPPEEARCAALREFGHADGIQERAWDERGTRWLDEFAQDVRFGIRMVRKNPGFAAVAVLSLAIGIGINSTVFSALDAAFLRPMPFPDSGQIVRLEAPVLSFGEYQDLRPQMRSLASVAASARHAAVLQSGGGSDLLGALTVSANYFSTLELQPAAGRFFSESDPSVRNERVVVLGYGAWQRFFAGDPRIVGQTITLSGNPWTVLGVAPKGFMGEFRIPRADVWFPVMGSDDSVVKGAVEFQLIGRLRGGASAEQAAAEARVVCSHLPENRGKEVWLWSERDWNADKGGRLSLLVMALVGLVLLVACANVASLLLARNEERRHEIAMRLALGSGRLRLLRQFLTEGLILALLGGAAGLLFTIWATRLIPALLPLTFSSLTPELHVDRRVLELTLILAFSATLVFALLPGLRASRVDLGPLLKGGGIPLLSKLRWLTSRNNLVVAQLAVSLVFLISAGLFVRGFFRGLQTDMGFSKRNVLLLGVSPGVNGLYGERGLAYLTQVQERLRGLPGVEAVSVIAHPPFALSGVGMQIKALKPGESPPSPDHPSKVLCNIAEPGYFAALGIPLLQGRDFTPLDDRTANRVVIVSDTLARNYWPNENPVGKTVLVGQDQPVPREVIGVAHDVVNARLGDQRAPNLYLPLRQEMMGDTVLLVATRGRPGDSAAAVRRELNRVDDRVKPLLVETMDGLIHIALFPQWLGLWLGGALGLLAFVLAVAGLYGVVAYSVSRRTRELGVRMALGAGRGDTIWLVLRQGLVLGLMGVGIGLPIAVLAGILMRDLLFGVGSADPVVLLSASVAVVGVVLAASYLPARRAASIDPMAALRCE